MAKTKDNFSKIGYILAMAGSAVGLGTAWKFPTITGSNGGFAFIFLYVLLCACVGSCAYLAEGFIGKSTKKDAKNALFELAPKHKKVWSKGSIFCALGLLIMPFYLVVVGWVFYYAISCLWGLPADNEAAKANFNALITQDLLSSILCFLAVFGICFFVLFNGIRAGIERMNLILMPALFVFLFILLAYSASFGDFSAALNFIFSFDFNKIFSVEIFLEALGLAAFSMSLGMGTIIAYSSRTQDNTRLFSSVFYIILLNTIVGILMGLVVFSFVPISQASSGAGLVFVSLMGLFGSLGVVGQILGFAFFSALFFAASTSAISCAEPSIFHLMQNYGFSRSKAILFVASFVLFVGILCIFSMNEKTSFALNFFGMSLFDILDSITLKYLMPLGALFFSIFVGFVVPKEKIFAEFVNESKWLVKIWYFLLRFVVPVGIIVIFVKNLWS